MSKRLLETRLSLLGAKELDALLREFPRRVVKKAMKQAVNVGATPIVRAARAGARKVKQSGLMAKAVNKNVKSYQSGVAVAVIGANTAVGGTHKGRNRIPKYYWHLVLGGTQPHALGKGSTLRKRDRQGGRLHPGSKANNILAEAVDATAGQVRGLMESKMRDVVTKEAAKLAAKGK